MTGVRRVLFRTEWLFYIVAISLATVGFLWPSEYWYEIRSITVDDARPSDLLLDVDRTIRRSFEGEYRVELRTFPDRTVVCTGGADISYDPDAHLPDDIDIGWWSGGGCDAETHLEVGEKYIILTFWEIDAIPFFTKYVSVESNPFRVNPVTTVALQKTRSFTIETPSPQLQMQVEALIEQVQSLEQKLGGDE